MKFDLSFQNIRTTVLSTVGTVVVGTVVGPVGYAAAIGYVVGTNSHKIPGIVRETNKQVRRQWSGKPPASEPESDGGSDNS